MTGEGLLNDLLKMTDHNANDTGTGSYREVALVWLDYIIKDIQNRQDGFRWRFLEKTATSPTVPNQHSYDLPTDIDTKSMVAVYDRTNDRTYKFIPYEIFVRLVPNPANSIGDPWLFTLFAQTLRLWPVPSSIFTFFLDYVKVMADATDDSTTIDIPDKYKKVIIDGLLTFAYQFDSELGDSKTQTGLYELGVKRMVSDNLQMPPEVMQPISHRFRHMRRFDIDRKNSTFFPLSSDNF